MIMWYMKLMALGSIKALKRWKWTTLSRIILSWHIVTMEMCMCRLRGFIFCKNMVLQMLNRRSLVNWVPRNGQRLSRRYVQQWSWWLRTWWNCMPTGSRPMVFSMDRIRCGSGSLKKCFRLRRLRISFLLLRLPKRTWKAPKLWTV